MSIFHLTKRRAFLEDKDYLFKDNELLQKLSPSCPARPARMRGAVGGFTLLEVMIAMAILAIALVAVYQSQSQSVSMAGEARFLTTASLLAQGRMAQIDALQPSAIKAEKGDFGDDFPDYSWQVEIDDTEVKLLKKVVVTVVNTRMTVRNKYRLTLYKVVT
jgi:general secretion pathway protein I